MDGDLKHDPYEAVRIPLFRKLLLTKFLGCFGDAMSATALGWQLYERTHSTKVLGTQGLLEAVPILLLSLHAGHLSDTLNRRKILILMRILMCLLAFSLWVLSANAFSLPGIYLCVFMIGVGRAYYGPASSTVLPQLVPEKTLPSAITPLLST